MHQVLTRNIFQVAYVTADLDTAIAQYRSLYGIDHFLVINTAEFNSDPALRAAFAWHGSVMIELVQPIEEPNPIYVDVLRGSESLTKLHHIGHVCSDEAEWNEVREALDVANVTVSREADVPGVMKFFYGDFRPINGHYREYILQHSEKSFFRLVPQN
jgi:glyoxalase/bleomycin resistance protein/dioxygenase superfamily protein